MKREIKAKKVSYDVVVVGGGLSGVCAAIASARHGARTAIVQARPMFGGNASSEIRMHVCGASANMSKPELEEGGILYELLLENKKTNDYFNYSIWDMLVYKKVREQEKLDYYLNTAVDDCTVCDNVIKCVTAYQQTTETRYEFTAPVFIDATGNATLGYLAGAEYRTGSEGKDEFNEPDAPEKANNERMGNTLLFKAVDRGHSVTFKRPDFAYTFTEEQLKYRTHGAVNKKASEGLSESYLHITSVGSATIDTGYWWIEVCGSSEDIIDEYEDIRDELISCVYGVWDHLKNGGDHGAENYDLEWVGILPGTRESRRLVGDYILNENDVLSNRQFDDAVAYGGWPMDVHCANGIFDFDKLPSSVYTFEGAYTIPYRSYCSKNILNLMMAGRNISATKMAMSSTRVMGTCSIGGQAVGTAAAMCIQYGCMPKGISEYMQELQQRLIADDCYIPNIPNSISLTKSATVTATSEREGFEAENILSGMTRPVVGKSNMWVSEGMSDMGETVSLELENAVSMSHIRLIFDTNFNYSVKQTQNGKRQRQQRRGVPQELVKDYNVKLWREGEVVFYKDVTDNYQRMNTFDVPSGMYDKVTVTVTATNGCEDVHIYEIGLYE